MAGNKFMNNAKAAKKDEFYTQYSDISDEMPHYRQHFSGKVVYCNCDDPTWSNFWKFFHSNFKSLQLKKLISTHYQKDTEPSYAMVYEGGDDFNMDAGRITEIKGNYATAGGEEVFYTAGDFRSDACIELLKEADVVVTNPPFSLFREYVAQLMKYEKADSYHDKAQQWQILHAAAVLYIPMPPGGFFSRILPPSGIPALLPNYCITVDRKHFSF